MAGLGGLDLFQGQIGVTFFGVATCTSVRARPVSAILRSKDTDAHQVPLACSHLIANCGASLKA